MRIMPSSPRGQLHLALDLVEVALRIVAVALQFIPGLGAAVRVDLPAPSPAPVGVGLILFRHDPVGLHAGHQLLEAGTALAQRRLLDGRCIGHRHRLDVGGIRLQRSALAAAGLP
jgi:hypothetical protein